MTAHPLPPSRIGKVTRRNYIDGRPMVYTVLDEIVYVPETNLGKAFYLQLLRFEDDGREEMRLCYYMIGHRPRARGKWLFGQFAPMICRKDFDAIMTQAREKGWIT
jgi:hypothetical protein